MYLSDIISGFVESLNALEYSENVKVIAAFPFAYKPTLLDKVLVAVSPYGMDVENIEIGTPLMYGDISIQLAVFVPQDMGSPCMVDTLDTILSFLSELKASRITVNSIQRWDNLSCYCAKCIFTYKNKI